MEVDESSAAKKPRVSSDADVPMEGSSWEEVSSPVGNPALAQGRLKRKALLWERDPLGALNRAHGSQR